MIPPYHPFIKTVANALRHRCGVQTSQHLMIGVSGGADSVALLRALAILAPRRRWRLNLAVAHVQHHLRQPPHADSDESEADARFVQSLARSLHIPCYRADLDLSMVSENLESAARHHRYAALDQLASQAACDAVVVAHHGDDQLETLLMRLLRGTSLRGLRGITWRRRLHPDSPRRLLRPMLGLNHAAAIAFLHDLNQPWRQDHSNADLTRLRARLRHEVLPVLRSLQPNAAGKCVQLTEHCRQSYRLLRGAAASLDHDATPQTKPCQITLQRDPLRAAPAIVLTELLRNRLTRLGAASDCLGNRSMQPLIRAIQDREGSCRQFHLSKTITVYVKQRTIQLCDQPRNPSAKLSSGGPNPS